MKSKILPLIICLPCILLKAFPSFGATTSWKGTASAAWTNSSNWTAGVPTTLTPLDVIIGDGNFSGTFQPSLSAALTVKSLTIGGSRTSTLTAGFALTVNGSIIINSNGTINSSAAISLTGDWSSAGNYNTTTASIVTFNGSVQSIGGTATTTFYKLTVNSTGTVTLTSSIILNSSSSMAGVILVQAGTFDLSTFLANRGTTPFAGGGLILSSGTLLKIGGTNTFPSSFVTITLPPTSTVEYNGANQQISLKTYGNLVLSSSGGSVIKTMPVTTLTVGGSLTSTVGSGTAVYFAAAANINVTGSVNINANTTFDGATFLHSITGDWINNGIFTSGTSTITLKGADSKISGSPVQNFYNLTVAGSVDLLNAGTVEVQNLVISPGFSLILDQATLQIAGTVNSAGNFLAGLGTIEMNGAATQTIPVNTFLGNTVDNLVISNSSAGGVVLDGAVDVYGSLTYSGTGMKLTTNDSLTIKSTSSNTARVGNMMTGDTIIGAVTVERYLAALRAWQFLSVPTNTTQTAKDSWQEGSGSTSDDLAPGYGTQITSDHSTWSEDGFDLNTSAPSMKRYNSATNSWVGIDNTNTDNIKATDGYMVFIRGDRTAAAYNSTPTQTILRTKGILYSGDQNPILVSANEFASIGNPYASALDMRSISKSGLKDFFYVWDPQLAGNKGFGGFQTFSNNGAGDYIITPGEGSYAGSDSGDVSDYIFSGLAFLIQADTLGGSLTFNEAAKTDSMGQVSRPAGLPRPRMRTRLYGVNGDNSTYIIDGVLNNYDHKYSNSVDGMDAIKLTNTSENLSIKTAGTLLAVERRHSIAEKDTIFLNLANTKVQKYRFEFAAAQLNQPGQTGFLEDTYLRTSTSLNLNGSTIVDFNIVNLPGSYTPDRFRIVFKPALVLALSVTSIKAFQENKHIAVEWKVENETNARQYETEKSNNGTQFTNLSVIAATGNTGHPASYRVTDAQPVEGYNYYRIKSVDLNGRIEYTNVVKILMGKGKQEISIYPNPVTGDIISIQLNNMPRGTYVVKLLNGQGQKVLDKIIHHTEGSSTELITMDKNMPHGIYHLQVIKPGNEMITKKLMY